MHLWKGAQMPTRLTQVKAAVLCHSVRGDEQLPTPRQRRIESAVWSIETPCREALLELSARQSMQLKPVGLERAVRAVPPFVRGCGAVIKPHLNARSSENSMLASLAGQPAPPSGLTQTWGA